MDTAELYEISGHLQLALYESEGRLQFWSRDTGSQWKKGEVPKTQTRTAFLRRLAQMGYQLTGSCQCGDAGPVDATAAPVVEASPWLFLSGELDAAALMGYCDSASIEYTFTEGVVNLATARFAFPKLGLGSCQGQIMSCPHDTNLPKLLSLVRHFGLYLTDGKETVSLSDIAGIKGRIEEMVLSGKLHAQMVELLEEEGILPRSINWLRDCTTANAYMDF